MKRTSIERQQRELKRIDKKRDTISKKSLAREGTRSVSDYINDLFSLFLYDGEEIFNINNEDKIFELLEQMKEELPEKQWENVIRKGIKKTGVAQKDRAFTELNDLIS